ncbi:MAG TPA: hypothetical protein DHN29_14155 [Cytophagales bacterium]|nr:hypothetical protein [Cytophagales bacterium]|tara:strand:+ start:91 stop:369 length:279 start_codon:yes stop_codon:yes gene_type:complete
MKKQRVAITLTFEADLDQFAGAYHQPEDWKQYVKDRLKIHCSYDPEVTFHTMQVNEIDYGMSQTSACNISTSNSDVNGIICVRCNTGVTIRI